MQSVCSSDPWFIFILNYNSAKVLLTIFKQINGFTENIQCWKRIRTRACEQRSPMSPRRTRGKRDLELLLKLRASSRPSWEPDRSLLIGWMTQFLIYSIFNFVTVWLRLFLYSIGQILTVYVLVNPLAMLTIT